MSSDTMIQAIETPPRFGVHELAFLLVSRTDAREARSRELLGIPGADHDDAVLYGLSSLVARGLIDGADGEPIPRDEAALVGYCLASADQWVTVTTRTPAQFDLVTFVRAGDVAMIVRRAPALTMDFVPLTPGADITAAILSSVARFLDAEPDLSLLVRAATLEELRNVFVHRVAGGNWGVGFDVVFPDDVAWPAPDPELTWVNREAVSDALTAALTGEGYQS